MKITINYKTGTTISDKIFYLAFDNGELIYTVNRNPSPVFTEPVRIPIDKVDSFVLENE